MSPQLRLSRPLTHDAFPHICRPDDLEFEIVEYSLDDQPPVTPDTDGIVDLRDYEGWDTATLTAQVTTPNDVLNDVFPESSDFPGQVVVAGDCRATYLRDRKILTSAPIEDETHTDEIELKVNGVGGTVELHPYLVRASDRDPVGDYGVREGVLLADGREWTVEVTEEDEGMENDLTVDKTSFSEKHEGEGETRFPPEEELYYLDIEQDKATPVLWFNEDHQEIVNIVWAGESDYDKLTEGLVWNHVVSGVWERMITIAAMEFDAEESEWTPEWQAGVFDKASQYLYPDENPDPRLAAKYLQEEFQEGGQVSATKRIERAVQEIIDPASGFTDHIDRLGED